MLVGIPATSDRNIDQSDTHAMIERQIFIYAASIDELSFDDDAIKDDADE